MYNNLFAAHKIFYCKFVINRFKNNSYFYCTNGSVMEISLKKSAIQRAGISIIRTLVSIQIKYNCGNYVLIKINFVYLDRVLPHLTEGNIDKDILSLFTT